MTSDSIPAAPKGLGAPEITIERIAEIIESHLDTTCAYDIAVEIYEAIRAGKSSGDSPLDR